ncbi:Holliday junction branch migration DNA helicase RuvB [Hippea maritima]|uniref:Holliday junction branch migration complex subunit RuvB n=1 Tax=Hippea maritima (strain ATCC 700847 / DSM 10411 / MH2) TaxID=760142 RepID=F2LXW9_HIPMA|nr:Holliday junction branch migration DNA helicase RuvB [Hippea maritima]AEA33234.1 Holliday junction ATP-dependent DNA helicase ruvB [Hippea maritima DSM 10411]
MEDKLNSQNLRPQNLNEYIGQKNIVKNLSLAIEAAKKRNEALEHCLFYGPPGLGKTTLANIVAKQMNANIITTSGPAVEKVGDIAAILTNLNEKDILFIDEIHRLNRAVEETLYSALEDFKLDIIVGQGPGARTIRIDLPHFTLIGATTRIGLLTSPLRDRFGIILRLDFYSAKDLTEIVKRSASILGLDIEEDAANLIAERSRGTPRIANKLLRRVRDLSQIESKDSIDVETAKKALSMLEIDENGLDYLDKKYILTLIEKFNGGPVGIETLSASIGEDKSTLEDVVEPYLLQIGYLKRTPKGRVATPLALKNVKYKRSLI